VRKQLFATSETGASTANRFVAPHLDEGTTLGQDNMGVTRTGKMAFFIEFRLVAESLATLLDLVQFARRGDWLGFVDGLLVRRVILLTDAPCGLVTRVNGRTLLRLARVAKVRPDFVDVSSLAKMAAHLADISES
jgi:hypothetical protein